MADYYILVRHLHIGAVTASGLLFLLRALGLHIFDASWPMKPWIRRLSYINDTILLGAAVSLMIIVRQYPFADAWLTVKIILIIIYITLGSYGLKYGKTRRIRISCTIAALVLYGFIITVARNRHPLGLFAETFFVINLP